MIKTEYTFKNMKRNLKNNFRRYLVGLFCCLSLSCSSLIKYEKTKNDFKTEEFDKKVNIVEVEENLETHHEAEKLLPPQAETKSEILNINTPDTKLKTASNAKSNLKNKSTTFVISKEIKKEELPSSSAVKEKLKNENKVVAKKLNRKDDKNEIKTTQLNKIEALRQPEIEDAEGFDNQRRPLIDPFQVGEKVTHNVSYFGASAGTLSFSVKSFAFLNGKKNYNFLIDIKSNSVFSKLVYAVDDQVQTYVDYETLTPGAFKLEIIDSGQMKEARSYFDFENLSANYWEHRFTEKNGHEEKKTNWTILPYSQNPFSSIFYMRIFKWTVGKEYHFRVADDEKNVIFKATALEKEKLNTPVGEFDAIKLKAEVVSRGNLSKAKDFYMWLSDDERKYVLRIEVKLPIGTLVSEVIDIKGLKKLDKNLNKTDNENNKPLNEKQDLVPEKPGDDKTMSDGQ